MVAPLPSTILTISGSYVDPLNLRPQDVRIEDIAHSLAHLCRFTGHVRRFYSVAEHCVRVSLMVPPQDALWGLLHDATEAYVNDVSLPVKRQPEMAEYRAIEARVQQAIIRKFRLAPKEPSSVLEADAEACRQEGVLLVPGWAETPRAPTFAPIRCFPPPAAKKAYLDRYSELTRLKLAA